MKGVYFWELMVHGLAELWDKEDETNTSACMFTCLPALYDLWCSNGNTDFGTMYTKPKTI